MSLQRREISRITCAPAAFQGLISKCLPSVDIPDRFVSTYWKVLQRDKELCCERIVMLLSGDTVTDEIWAYDMNM